MLTPQQLQSLRGDFYQADFFNNAGGLNLTDSPFRLADTQSMGGYNFEFTLTGGIKKRNGHTKQNTNADTQLKTLGVGLYTALDGTKTNIRAAGTKIQAYSPTAFTFTNLTEDTAAAASDFLNAASNQQAVFSQLNTGSNAMLWMAGAGVATGKLYGVASATKVTQNGAVAPTGAITATASGADGTIPAGTYYYAVTYRKASTLAESNAALDVSVTVASTNHVVISLTGLTGLDTTKYDKINIYRSSVGGANAFTAGVLVAQVASTTTSYTDTGTILTSSVNVPRAANTVLDNSTLPATGTYTALATFKRFLVAASGNTLNFSDQGKPESWPVGNQIVVPYGGNITGLGVISFNTPTTSSLDELLVVFQERQLWVVNGTDFSNFTLKFIDAVGCPNQTLIVTGNGYLAWIDYRGVYLWDGSGKPIYASRPIEYLFSKDGDLDKANLALGWGSFYRKTNQLYWVISHQVKGVQQYIIKMDLRLTLPMVGANLTSRVLDGVFAQDSLPFPLYAGLSFLPSSTYEEMMLAGDNAGFMYSMYDSFADASAGVDFSYETKFFDFGKKGAVRRYQQVIVWTQDSSDAQLSLDWWTKYKSDDDSAATMSQPASSAVSNALWDLAYWDAANWNQNLQTYNPVVFNLNSAAGSTEGDCLKLRFRQSDANAPITIAGFSIIYSELGTRK